MRIALAQRVIVRMLKLGASRLVAAVMPAMSFASRSSPSRFGEVNLSTAFMLFARLLGRAGLGHQPLGGGRASAVTAAARQHAGDFFQTLVVVQQLDLGLVLAR